jgi:hypothetical protein
MDVSEEQREGYYRDETGQWRFDRRKTDRRRQRAQHPDARERRREFRRRADREVYERDHKQMIEEALQDFAEEHEGHL